MKLTKSQLKEIIKEEIELAERVTPEYMEALDKVKAIKDVIDEATVDGKLIHYRGLDILSQIQDILNPVDVEL